MSGAHGSYTVRSNGEDVAEPLEGVLTILGVIGCASESVSQVHESC